MTHLHCFYTPQSLRDSSHKTVTQCRYILGVSKLYYVNSPPLPLGEVARSAGGVYNRILAHRCAIWNFILCFLHRRCFNHGNHVAASSNPKKYYNFLDCNPKFHYDFLD